MRRTLSAIPCLLVLFSVTSHVHGEHRVALLIGNSEYKDSSLNTPVRDLQSLASSLAKYGVRCTIAENLDEKTLQSTIEHFASQTPTAGTAIIYFAGQVQLGSHKGNEGVSFLGTDAKPGKGFPIPLVLDALTQRGGSRVNVVIADGHVSADTILVKSEVLDYCLVTYSDHATLIKNLTGEGNLLTTIQDGSVFATHSIPDDTQLTGKGSAVVAPPDQFAFGKNAGDEWVNSRGMVFCWCPPGRYIKGSPGNEPHRDKDEEQAEVIIKDGFWISKYELTVGENPRNRSHKTIAERKNDPITMINHDDARVMTHKTLTEHGRKAEQLPADWQYSLPTEQQWEYAARAGATTAYHFGNDVNLLPQYGNFADKTYYDTGDVFSLHAHRTLDDGVAHLSTVGRYKPNNWGIHDMHGNVSEWCVNFAVRGGSWASTAPTCRIAYRTSFSSRNEQNFIGYRIVIQKTPPPEPKKSDK